MQGISFKTNTYVPFRPAWLDLHREEILEPDLPIIDAHHHLWGAPRQPYMMGDLISDISGGHNIKATVYTECRSMYRQEGPVAFRPLGEVEFVEQLARQEAGQAGHKTRYCEKIIGHADLTLGDAVAPVLQGLIGAGKGRLCGIRHSSAYNHDPEVLSPAAAKPAGLLLDKGFQQGFRHLSALGLSFDAFLYHPQIPDLTQLARAFPDTAIILDHLGCPIGIGSYAGQRGRVFSEWASAMAALATCPNVMVKLGGLGMQVAGFDFHRRDLPPSSQALAEAWKPYIETCIELFGAERCMFESNFPPDKGSCSYSVLWNAFKRLTLGCSAAEKADLFYNTAARSYKMTL